LVPCVFPRKELVTEGALVRFLPSVHLVDVTKESGSCHTCVTAFVTLKPFELVVNGIDVVLEHEVAVEGQVALVTLKVSNVQMYLQNVTLKV
jgi:hypothetical protein